MDQSSFSGRAGLGVSERAKAIVAYTVPQVMEIGTVSKLTLGASGLTIDYGTRCDPGNQFDDYV